MEGVLDGEVGPAVPGEQRPDPQRSAAYDGGVVTHGEFPQFGDTGPEHTQFLAGLITCQVHDNRQSRRPISDGHEAHGTSTDHEPRPASEHPASQSCHASCK